MRRRVPSELTTNRLSWNYEYWVEACAVRLPPRAGGGGADTAGLSIICPVHVLNITCTAPHQHVFISEYHTSNSSHHHHCVGR